MQVVIRKNKSEVTFVLRFAQPVRNVRVVGSFNAWDEEQGRMQKGKNGEWRKRVNLQPGRYEYKFVVDGEWQVDPDASESVRNQFGTENSVLQLA
jgi:1,4-alpha-glucan branching enzyme